MTTTGLIAPTSNELVAEACRRSLRRFVMEAWPLVEPGTPFIPNWHVDVICDHLEAVSRGEIRRLIINIPPRHMKSLSAAVFWPCWEWLERPETKWLFASYAQSLSTRDSLKCRRLMKTEGVSSATGRMRVLERIGYRGLLELVNPDPWEFSEDQDAKQRFENTRHGYRLATSVGGSATGEGGDIIVVDDAHKTDEAESELQREGVLTWFDGTMRTRLNQPMTGAFVIIMQRVHEEDLVGHLLEEDGWTHVCLPAEYEPAHPFVWPQDPRDREGELLWPTRVDAQALADLKRMGAYRAAGQLQQRPAPAEGLWFKRKHFRTWRPAEHTIGALTAVTYLLETDAGDVLHIDAGMCRVFQTADVAASEKATSDWTVVATWAYAYGQHKLLLLEIDRQHFDQLDVDGFLARKNDQWNRPPMWLETFGAGSGPYKVLSRAQDRRPVMPLRPEHGTGLDKGARAWAAIAAYEHHDIYHPQDAEWLGEFEHELLSFPNGKNDDQVDAVSYAARLLTEGGIATVTRAKQQDNGAKPYAAGIRDMQF